MDLSNTENNHINKFMEGKWSQTKEDFWEYKTELSINMFKYPETVRMIELNMLKVCIEEGFYNRLNLMSLIKYRDELDYLFNRTDILYVYQRTQHLHNTGEHLDQIDPDVARLVWESLK